MSASTSTATRACDALDVEVELVERGLAEHALASPDVRRLMTIPVSARRPHWR